MSAHPLHITADLADLARVESLHVVGRAGRLTDAAPLLPVGARPAWASMLEGSPGDHGRTAVTWLGPGPPGRVVAAVLPEACSRHNSPSRAWAYPRLVHAHRAQRSGVVAMLDDATHARAVVAAVARSCPTFSARSRSVTAHTTLLLMGPDGPIRDPKLQLLADAVRRAAHLVDQPPDQFGPDAFVQAAREVASLDGVRLRVLRAAELEAQGLGGLAAVGRASTQQPALVVLEYAPMSATHHTVWVGKGITYDTGGLSIKTKTGMPGMKTDMGGAAAVLAAFEAAVRMGLPQRVSAVLCIAENSVGPNALRPDDILTMYSKRTVEVNNTDAEGRLVLADGVAWAVEHLQPDTLIDLATLTGAQAVATGKLHAALYCNDDELERRAVHVGRASGDLVHPLVYAPELLRKEFSSAVADMRNSVKDRSNAQSSCAGQFIANHLGAYTGPWLHVDMAAPAHDSRRGTGFGVALLLGLLSG